MSSGHIMMWKININRLARRNHIFCVVSLLMTLQCICLLKQQMLVIWSTYYLNKSCFCSFLISIFHMMSVTLTLLLSNLLRLPAWRLGKHNLFNLTKEKISHYWQIIKHQENSWPMKTKVCNENLFTWNKWILEVSLAERDTVIVFFSIADIVQELPENHTTRKSWKGTSW